MKECLACTFENLGLIDDGLRIYDELEAGLIQSLRASEGGQTIRLGLEEFQRDEKPLLPRTTTSNSTPEQTLTTYQNERDQISHGSYTLYEYRCFLLRRQISLLGSSIDLGLADAPAQASLALRRGVAFIVGMGQWLRDRQLSKVSATHTVEAWVYDAALSLGETCATWIRMQDRSKTTAGAGSTHAKGISKEGFKTYNRLRGELLSVALAQLDRVGILSGFLPAAYPFILTSFSAPKQNAILFEGPGESPRLTSFANENGKFPAIPQPPRKQNAEVSSSRTLIIASRSEKSFLEAYDHVLGSTIEAEDKSGRIRERQSLTEKKAALAL